MNRREFGKLGAAAALGYAHRGAAAQTTAGTNRVHFSVMLWALENQAPFDRCVEWVAEAGYQGVELVGEFQKWSSAERAAMVGRMRKLGLVFDAMSGVRAGFAVPEQKETFRTQFAEHLRSVVELECAKVILLSGQRVEGLAEGVQLQMSIENLKWASEQAAKANVEIVIEPIDLLEQPHIYLASVAEGFEIAKAVSSPQVKVLYDFYHEQRSFGNLLEKLERNIDWVGLVHVADVPGRHDPGTGEIDYASIYRMLGKHNYANWIAMEYYPTGEPVASLRRARIDAQAVLG